MILPFRIKDKTNGIQHTVGNFDVGVSLPAEQKGTHMSRFVQYLSSIDEPMSLKLLSMTVLPDIKRKLEANSGYIKVKFPYFIEVIAPMSKKYSLLKLSVEFEVKDEEVFLTVTTPVTTLCPCSKEISDYGAHNQRSHIMIKIQSDGWVWVEELMDIANKSASCEIYPLLKRPDEKYVTEKAYDKPKFVEDVVREVKIALERHSQIKYYRVEAVNHESIHAHDAYAVIEGRKCNE